MSSLSLDGRLVVLLEQATAVPFASRRLADLGARVIKVERAIGGFARTYDETMQGVPAFFWLNRTKESVVVDLRSTDGAMTLR